jgi:hypothetical protein
MRIFIVLSVLVVLVLDLCLIISWYNTRQKSGPYPSHAQPFSINCNWIITIDDEKIE